MNKNPTNMLTQTQIMDALNRRHSPEKQRLLSEGHVAIAGLGGLGSNVACALARIGVGHLHLIDFDVVDITNLNRQQYFIGQLGMYKTDALKSLLEQINPYLDIRTDCIRVTRENLRELFADAPIVCGSEKRENDVQCAFASDLMSDVLTLDCGDVLLVTGLCNLQTIRTAEMAEVSYILFVRGKKVTPDMLELARENNMVLLETDHSMYHTVGELYSAGLLPIY